MKSRSLSIIISILTISVLIIGGCSGLSYNSKVAPEIEKSKYDSFSVISPIQNPTVAPVLYEFIKSLVNDELIKKGYQSTNLEEASVKVAIFARLDEVIDKSAYGTTYQKTFEAYKIDKEGTLQVIMFDGETGAWLWKGELTGVAKEEYPGESEKSKKRLQDAIVKMLSEIPYRT